MKTFLVITFLALGFGQTALSTEASDLTAHGMTCSFRSLGNSAEEIKASKGDFKKHLINQNDREFPHDNTRSILGKAGYGIKKIERN